MAYGTTHSSSPEYPDLSATANFGHHVDALEFNAERLRQAYRANFTRLGGQDRKGCR